MFNCQDCGKTKGPKENSNRVVVQERNKTYAFRKEGQPDGNDDPGGRGKEIVCEVVVCNDCLPKYQRKAA